MPSGDQRPVAVPAMTGGTLVGKVTVLPPQGWWS
jgi:hypothetical protein